MNFFKLVIFIIFLSFIYVVYQNITVFEQLPSPYIVYKDLIKGTYRFGYVDLDKECSIDQLEVKGKVPTWLTGTFLRNGPAKFNSGDSFVNHWFDGLAMLHAFLFDNGNVSYANKFLRTDAYNTVKDKGKMTYLGFAQDPCKSLFKRLCTFFIPESFKKPTAPNANVSISRLGGKYVALTEIPLPIAFEPETLETLGVVHYHDSFPESNIHECVHPHYDYEKKEHLGFLTRFGRKSTHDIYRIKDGTTQRECIASIEVTEPSYMHSFAITPHYIILSLIPFVVNPLDFIFKNKPFIQNFTWKPELQTTFAVVDREQQKVIGFFKADPFFTFHHVNAYEQDNKIIVDSIVYDTPSQIDIFYLTNVLAPDDKFYQTRDDNYSANISKPQLKRFVIDLIGSRVISQKICDPIIELPRINYEEYNGKKYQYAYAGSSQDVRYFDSLIKVYVDTGETISWSQNNCYPSEPIFIKSPQGIDEDEGVILSVVLNAQTESSFLLVLDAKNFKEIARAEVPHAIPFGLHGIYDLKISKLLK